MARVRSPGYPAIPLEQAVQFAGKIFHRNRHNPTDREAAVRDIGYGSLTGQTTKLLSDMSHYDLIERAGKGGVRVTDVAARILHSHNQSEKIEALLEAAYAPTLFAEIKNQWPDGYVSENSLRSYLIRQGFASSALQSALRAYTETYAYLQREGATESHRQAAPSVEQSAPLEPGTYELRGNDAQLGVSRPAPQAPAARGGVELMASERIVFVDEAGASQYIKLIASGDIDAGSLEALEDYIKRQKRRLTSAPTTQPSQDDNAA